MLNKNKDTKMTKLIAKYEHLLAVAESHAKDGVEYRDSDIHEDIAFYKNVLKVIKTQKFQREMAQIFATHKVA